jgi:hypothetical protein
MRRGEDGMTDRKYDHTIKGRIEHAEECCRLANDRARLEQALTLVLGLIGFGPREQAEFASRARDCDFDWVPEEVVPQITKEGSNGVAHRKLEQFKDY